MREDVFGGEATHEQTFDDIALLTSSSGIILAFFRELKGEFVAALHALGCNENVIYMHE